MENKKVENTEGWGFRCNPKAYIIDENVTFHSISFNVEYDKTGRSDFENQQFPKLIIKGLNYTHECLTIVNPNSYNWPKSKDTLFYSILLPFEETNTVFGQYNTLPPEGRAQLQNELKIIIGNTYNKIKSLEDKRISIESVSVKYHKPVKELYLKDNEEYHDFRVKYNDIFDDINGCESFLHFIDDTVYISLNCRNIFDGSHFEPENIDSFMETIFDIEIKKEKKNEKDT